MGMTPPQGILQGTGRTDGGDGGHVEAPELHASGIPTKGHDHSESSVLLKFPESDHDTPDKGPWSSRIKLFGETSGGCR